MAPGILINPVLRVFVPYQSVGIQGTTKFRRTKADWVPRFVTPDEVMEFLQRNPGASFARDGSPVKLDWIEHDEAWAIAEYAAEVGKKGWL